MNNEITFDGLTTHGACAADVALVTMKPAAAAAGALVVAKRVKKIAGTDPT